LPSSEPPTGRFPLSEAKLQVLQASKTFWNPDKTQFWQEAGVDLVIDRREGYCLYDMDGKRLIDVHLNGGTYNLGHRNAELIEVLNAGARRFDMGNHHFPALARTALAEKLAACTPAGLQYTIYGAGGAEAVELAIKSARNATQKRKIVSIVPFNDLDAMEDALKGRDVAAVIMETIPATYGFPMPHEGYLPSVKKLCERYDALYIADEVQTGLMRTGQLWGITRYGVTPDIMVIGKGITGGMYPISCCVVSERAGAWLKQDGFAHMSTAGGAELGCIVALKVLEITQRPEVASMVRYVSDFVRAGLDEIQALYPDFFIGIRQHGVVMGLEFNDPEGAKPVMRRLYEHGVWAIFSTLDPSVLQFKPGILMTQDLCEDLLRRVETAIGLARDDVMSAGRRKVS
jgi:acetylornithine/succinyldiaminopimelate/putrescine aminotransferase